MKALRICYISVVFLSIVLTTDVIAMNKNLIDEFGYEETDDATVLIVMLHGYAEKAASLGSLQNTLDNIVGLQGADYLIPELPTSRFSTAPPNQIVAELICEIDRLWIKKEYGKIIFVGHSVGGLIARKIYIAASGENKREARFEHDLVERLRSTCSIKPTEQRKWIKSVEKILLFAGMNNGWTISHHMSIAKAVAMKLGVAYGYIQEYFTGETPFIFHARNGSSFITQIRLQWLALSRRSNEVFTNLSTVQFLGTIDDVVAPDDNLDLVTGDNFTYIEVPHSDHGNIVDMSENEFGSARAVRVKSVFLDSGVNYSSIDYQSRIRITNPEIDDVVFVVHGIRDLGHWTQKLANRVRVQSLKSDASAFVESETSSYGYFPMLSFLNPGARQEKVNWLMNRYVEAKAVYPNADFHYIGHSHGTYLLARALHDYESVKFKRVVFAGSVVRTDFNWEKYIPGQVESVINFVSTADWVVAFFPKALQSVGFQDLGSAGHDGFDAAEILTTVESTNSFTPVTYIKGGHSSALQEPMWDALGRYVVSGDFSFPDSVERADEQSYWVSLPGKVAPVLWFLGITILLGILIGLIKLDVREWFKTCLIIIYLSSIWWVVTTV